MFIGKEKSPLKMVGLFLVGYYFICKMFNLCRGRPGVNILAKISNSFPFLLLISSSFFSAKQYRKSLFLPRFRIFAYFFHPRGSILAKIFTLVYQNINRLLGISLKITFDLDWGFTKISEKAVIQFYQICYTTAQKSCKDLMRNNWCR